MRTSPVKPATVRRYRDDGGGYLFHGFSIRCVIWRASDLTKRSDLLGGGNAIAHRRPSGFSPRHQRFSTTADHGFSWALRAISRRPEVVYLLEHDYADVAGADHA